MRHVRLRRFTRGLAALLAALTFGAHVSAARAASHREAPLIGLDPAADNTDVYAFRSWEDPSKAVFIMNVIPSQVPASGPNFFSFDDDILYTFHFDLNADGSADDAAVEIRFATEIRPPFTDLPVSFAGVDPVPGLPPAITALDGPGSEGLGLRQRYTVRFRVGGQVVAEMTADKTGKTLYAVPSNVGARTMPSYEALASQGVFDLGNGIRVFAGQRKETFYIDLASTFDTLNFRRNPPVLTNAEDASDSTQPFGVNDFAGLNVNTIAIEVPIALLPDTVGLYASTSRRFDRQFFQVSRMANPLVNEVIIGTGQKDFWNTQDPKDEAQFLGFYQNPRLAAILNLAFGIPVPPAPRADLVSVLLQYPTGGAFADLLRLDLTVPPTSPASQRRLTVLAHDAAGNSTPDPAGWPNGRRPNDDVTDIAIRAVAGAISGNACCSGVPAQPPGRRRELQQRRDRRQPHRQRHLHGLPVPAHADRRPAVSGGDAMLATRLSALALAAVLSWPLAGAPVTAEAGSPDESIGRAQWMLARNPRDARAYYRLGDAYIQKARETGDAAYFDRAEQSLRNALAIHPEYGEAARHLAFALYSKHDFAGAVAEARRAIALSPRDGYAHGILGDAYQESGRYADAWRAYERMMELQPDFYAYSRRSGARSIRGDSDGAIADLERAIELGRAAGRERESVAWAQWQLATEHLARGDVARAEAQQLAALETYPDYHRALAGLGDVRAAQGRYDEAIALYRRARGHHPDARLRRRPRRSLRRRRRWRRGQEAIRPRRVHRPAQLAQRRRSTTASSPRSTPTTTSSSTRRSTWRERELEVRTDVYAWDLLAWALYKNGRPAEAAAAMAQALALGTRDSRLYFHAGMIHRGLGDDAKARAYLERALALNPRFHVLHARAAARALGELSPGDPAPTERGARVCAVKPGRAPARAPSPWSSPPRSRSLRAPRPRIRWGTSASATTRRSASRRSTSASATWSTSPRSRLSRSCRTSGSRPSRLTPPCAPI